jgi:hypothetical protein
VKTTLLWFASLLFIASLSLSAIVVADDAPPVCDPNTGCSKPGVALMAGLNQ